MGTEHQQAGLSKWSGILAFPAGQTRLTFPQARRSPCDHHHRVLQIGSHSHALQQPEEAKDTHTANKQWDDDSAGEIHELRFLNVPPRAAQLKQAEHYTG